MINTKVVTKKLKEFDKIEYLLKNAFPKVEQMSTSYLLVMSKRKAINFLAFYDDDLFIGFSYFIKTKDMIFITYIAINDEIRSKGYGSKILTYLKESNPTLPISLNVEMLIDDAPNKEQRIKRVKFYERNGFILLKNTVSNGKDSFSIMSTKQPLDIKSYRKALKQYSFGLYAPKVK